MQINNKIFHVASIIFSILTIASIFLVSIDIAIIFLGFSQLSGGLVQVKLSQGIDSKGTNKGNKVVGIFSIIVGLFIIITYIIKSMF